MEIGQGPARLGRIGLDDIGERRGRNKGQRAQRQAVTDRTVAGDQMEHAAPRLPFFAAPVRSVGLRLPALDRQHVSGWLGQASRKDEGDAVALLGILQLGVLRRDVRGEIGLLHDPLRRILVGRRNVGGFKAEFRCDLAEQRLRLFAVRAAPLSLRRDELGVQPDRLAVAPPVERKGPARQGFARIPFALPVMQESARRETIAQAADEPVGERALRRADGVRVPFVRLEIVDRDEGRLAAHGEAHVVGDQLLVDLLAESVERLPRFFRKGLGDARVLGDAFDAHVELEIDVGETRHARNRRGVAIVRRRGKRDVTFAGKQTRGRIKADPAGAGKIDLGPGVQIGEVMVRAGRAVESDEIRFELDEIAGHEPRGQPEVSQDLHEKPARVAARARSALERLLRALHPRLHADDVFDLLRQPLVEIDHKIDRALRRSVDPIEKGLEPRPRALGRAVDDEIGPQVLAIFERPNLRAFLDEEIERIVDRHVGDDVDLDLEFIDQFGKDIARQPVAIRVLLDVHEMIGRRNFQRMRYDPGAAMGRGPEPNDLRPERDRPVIVIVRQVMDGGSDRHAGADS